jgi:hypothetical protein
MPVITIKATPSLRAEPPMPTAVPIAMPAALPTAMRNRRWGASCARIAGGPARLAQAVCVQGFLNYVTF